jgi:phosphatidylinositol-3-phosphatase
LPKTGFGGCASGRYVRKHNPWVNFGTLPASTNRPLTAFPRDYNKAADRGVCEPEHVSRHARLLGPHRGPLDEKALRPVRALAPGHNSWLIATFDENAGGRVKPIFTILVGEGIRPGRHGEWMNHYTLLRTIQAAYGLPALGRAKGVRPLSTIWTRSPIPRGRRNGR